MGLNRLKLKHQIILLIAISAVLLILIQTYNWLDFYDLTKIRAINYEQKIIDQTFVKIDSVLKDIKTNANLIVLDKNMQEFVISSDYFRRDLVLGPFILDMMEYVKAFNSIIYSIQIEDNKGRAVNNLTTTDGNIFNTKEYTTFVKKYNYDAESFRTPMFTSVMTDPNTGKEFFFYLVPIIEVLGGENFAKKMGVCTIMINTSNIEELIENAELTPNSILAVVDSEGKVIVANKSARQRMLLKDIPQDSIDNMKSVNITTFQGRKVIIQQRNLEQADGWKIVSIVPINELTNDMNSKIKAGLSSIAGMILILFTLGIMFYKNITQPVTGLVTDMKKIGESKIDFRLKVRSTNEVGILATEINSMMDRIEEMTRNIFNSQSRMYEMELTKKQAEFSALQSQINPHFLYNTLNCISSIGLAYGIKEIAQICSSMSMIFRYSIKSADLVSISEEIGCVDAYLNIIKIRYKGKYLLEISVDPCLLEMKTPKMLLQPIVENAIYHGLENNEHGGQLTVKGYIGDNSNVCFSIFDSGAGIKDEKLNSIRDKLQINNSESLKKSNSIGLENINNRIKLLFGDKYGLWIESKVGWGTKVIIKIPRI